MTKSNTGDSNTGNRNTGDSNTGDSNTGNWNTGNRNTGNWNTGNRNTGNRNTGDRNTGNWNTGNWNTGYFNTIDQGKVQVFDGQTVDRAEFIAACPAWLFDPRPTTWVFESEMTDQEKIDNETFHTTGGYLRVNDWHEEWRKAYEGASAKDIQRVRDLTGFNAGVFKAITGLDLATAQSDNKPQYIEVDGVRYVRSA